MHQTITKFDVAPAEVLPKVKMFAVGKIVTKRSLSNLKLPEIANSR